MGLKSCCRKGPIAAFMVLILFCGCREDLIARIQSGARYSAAHREESSKEFKGIKSLIVSEVAGTIGIQFEKGDLATVNATKVIHAATKDTAKKHADDLNVRFEIDGETLKVFAEYPGDIRKLEFDGYVSYDIYLLEGTAVQANNVAGDIILSGGAGDLNLETVSGNVVSAGRIVGDANIKTVSGMISLQDCEGNVDLDSVSGNISYSSSDPPRGDLNFQTIDGSIWVNLSKDSDLEVKISNLIGSTDVKLPISNVVESGHLYAGKLNRATQKLIIETVSGGIELK